MAITHIKDGQGFFDAGHAATHRDFGFTGSAAEVPRQSFAKGGAVSKANSGHADVAQDRALISKMMKQHEAAEGDEPMRKADGGSVDKYAGGGRARLPTGMKATAMQRHSPINTPPRNPTKTVTPRNIMPGGAMAYGVQPSAEPAQAGSEQGIPQLKDGGKVRMGADRSSY